MEPVDLIARMAAKTPDMEAVGVSSVEGLDGADAALMLAGLDRGPYLLARVKYAGELDSQADLETVLWHEMVKVAADRGWRRYGDGLPRAFLRNLSHMAVDEIINPCKCSACGGRGSVYPRGKAARVCDVCLGTGSGRVSGSARARQAGIDKSNWCRLWAGRYAIFLNRLDGWERVLQAHGDARLKA